MPCRSPGPNRNFYPRSPCGERRGPKLCQFLRALISIHALLAESDTLVPHQQKSGDGFLSTLSLRRATDDQTTTNTSTTISIHALLAESDSSKIIMLVFGLDFYPRSPCGERLGAILELQCVLGNFYPRSPCGERRQFCRTGQG